jgi:hypothetical protein
LNPIAMPYAETIGYSFFFGEKVMLENLMNLLKSNRRSQIDPTDGIETTTERLIPGDEAIEKIRWHVGEFTTGLAIPAVARIGWLAYQYSPIAHLHVLIWCGLVGFCAHLILERLNALLGAKTWALYSGFIILLGAALGIGFWAVL